MEVSDFQEVSLLVWNKIDKFEVSKEKETLGEN